MTTAGQPQNPDIATMVAYHYVHTIEDVIGKHLVFMPTMREIVGPTSRCTEVTLNDGRCLRVSLESEGLVFRISVSKCTAPSSTEARTT